MQRTLITQALCALTLLAATATQAAPISKSDDYKSNSSGSSSSSSSNEKSSYSSCQNGDIGGRYATDCMGYAKVSVLGNDSVSTLQKLIGDTAWHGMKLADLTQYKDDTVAKGSSNALFDVFNDSDDATKGRLTFLKAVTGPAVLTLKGGNNWAAYYLPKGAEAGTELKFDIPVEKGAGLSHASLFLAPTAISTPLPALASAVPEPSGLALVMLALGGAAASTLRRRRG